MDVQSVRDYIIRLMQEELDIIYSYHSLEHTLDVASAARRLGELENIGPEEMALVETAALLHDVGMIESPNNHEETSVRIAKEILPGFGYLPRHIDAITDMIMCTRMPQYSSNLLSNILCDADLDYLGREDYLEIASRLKNEWENLGNPMPVSEWYKLQFEFLNKHEYFTKAALELRSSGKQKNIALIRQLMNNQRA